jgi:hypothetical protein
MPHAKGDPKTGGRKAGTPNKLTGYLAAKPDGYSPFETLFLIARNQLPCSKCRGTGRTKYWKPLKKGQIVPEIGSRICESCYGDKLERLSPETILKAASELGQYESPKKKAIEVTGEDGGPITACIELIVRKAPDHGLDG